MKKLILATLTIILFDNAINAQSSPDLKEKTDSGWRVTTYYDKGNVQDIRYYSDDSCKNQNGDSYFYLPGNHIYSRSQYRNGKLDGVVTEYSLETGHPLLEMHFIAGAQEGESTAWYESGKVAGKATFQNNKQTAATFFNEDGTPNKRIKEIYKESSFPGGPAGWLQFLTEHMSYPKDAINRRIQGVVIIGFYISKEGKVSNITVATSVSPSLDKAALAVIKRTPNWEPALLAGVPVASYKKQPIVFKIEE